MTLNEIIKENLSTLIEDLNWNNFLSMLSKNSSSNEFIYEDLVLAIAENSNLFPPAEDYVNGGRFIFSHRTYALFLELNKGHILSEKCFELLKKVITKSSSFGFAVHLTKLVIDHNFSDTRRRMIKPTEEQDGILKEALKSRAEEYFNEKSILDSDNDDLVSLIYWVPLSGKNKQKILSELEENPGGVKRFLYFIAYDISNEKLKILNERISVFDIFEAIKNQVNELNLNKLESRSFHELKVYINQHLENN